ncbi:MAG: hypothetical protein OEZ65_17225, partial [Gemmatimonadota bacterium]|nr:hypothetical protein [Gemmatimonadota bacterium]
PWATPRLWDAPVQVREDPAIRSLSDVPGHFVEASTAPGLFLAVLPARTEAVAWVYGDSTLLLGVLAAVATALHLRGRLVVPLVLSACAYLVREDAVLLPFALLVDRNRAGGATPPQP